MLIHATVTVSRAVNNFT